MYWILWKTRGSFGAAFGETSRHRIARKSFGIHYGIHSEFERDIFNRQHVLAQVAITITAWLHPILNIGIIILDPVGFSDGGAAG